MPKSLRKTISRRIRRYRHREDRWRFGSPPLIFPEKKLALFWSPKAGCTFAAKWFFFHQGLLEEALAHHQWIHRYRIQIYIKGDDYKEERKRLPSSGYYIAKLVRSPYRRAVSSFTHAIKTHYLEDELARHLGREVEENRRFTFEEFVDYLTVTKPQDCNPHCRQQVTPTERSNRLRFDKVVKLENSTEELKAIEKMLGLSESNLGDLSQSHHNTPYLDAGGYCGAVAYPRKPDSFGTYANFYNDEMQNKVAEIFAEDFAAYGYDPNII